MFVDFIWLLDINSKICNIFLVDNKIIVITNIRINKVTNYAIYCH